MNSTIVGKTPKPYTKQSNRIPESPNQDGSTMRNPNAQMHLGIPPQLQGEQANGDPTLIPQGKQHTAIVTGGRLGSRSPATATAA
jgi:hypothetical protein